MRWAGGVLFGLALTLCIVPLITLWSSTVGGDVAKRKFEFDWREPFLLFVRVRLTPALIAPVLAFFLFQFGFMVYYTFIMIEMQRSYGFSTAQIGLFSMVMGCGFVAGTSFGYKIAKKLLGADTRVATVGLAVCGVLVGLTALPMPASAQVVLTMLIAISNILAFVTLLAASASAVVDSEHRWALGLCHASVALSVFASGLLSSLLSIIPSDAFEILGGLLILSAIVLTQRLTITNTKAVTAQ